MIPWAKRWTVTVVGGCLMTGCANVEVSKVDVQKRIEGQDHHVKGFRYYLTRPYIVVSDRVPVATSYIPVALAVFPRSAPLVQGQPWPVGAELCLVAQVPDDQGRYRVYDAAGHQRPELTPNDVQTLPRKEQKPPGPANVYSSLRLKIRDIILQEVIRLREAAGIKLADMDPITTAILKAIDSSDLEKLLGQGKGSDGAKDAAAKALAATSAFLGSNEPWKGKMVKVTLTAEDILKDENVKALIGQTAVPKDVEKPKESGTPALVPSYTLAPGTTTPPPPAPPAGDQKPSGTPPGPFQVVFLPDFEEQYAIKNCNFLAKTKYKYTFHNGTELETMAGSYNATDVPVKLVETVGRLVQAVGEVAKTGLQTFPVSGALRGAMLANPAPPPPDADFFIRIEQAIEPGVYRVQKSWEMAAACDSEALKSLPHDKLNGLFSEIGLPIVDIVSVITGTEHDLAAKPPPPKTTP